MKIFDVCVIGGGASGSMCAVLLAQKNINVCVVDKFDVPAKKLLVTGNGRCNITNQNMSSDFYNQNIDEYLKQFNQVDSIKFFEHIGIDIYADSEGRCYPISNTAKSVQMAFINQFEKLGIDFLGGTEVVDVEIKNDIFNIKTTNQTILAKKVIVACGINELSKNLCKKFDIDCAEVVPSLVALKTKQHTKRLDGTRVSDVLVTAKVVGNQMSQIGEVLFKEHGLSGIAIFNLSSLFAKNKCFEGKISINLLKNWSKSQIFEKIYSKVNTFLSMQNLLFSMFEKELAREILLRCDISFERKSKELSKKDFEKIVDVITNFEFDVVGCYQNNQVLSGGVKLLSLTKNLQCKNQNGLYFVGEVCDVDAVCGGYNLQWAWTSAFVATNDILKGDL